MGMKQLKIVGMVLAWLGCFGLAQAQSWGMYTLYSVGGSSNAYLVDTSNNVYHTWTFTGANTGYSSYLLPGQILCRSVKVNNASWNGGGLTGRIQKVDWSGNVLWDYTHSASTYILHHDHCPMPNGNVLMIAYELKTATEASTAGCTQNIAIQSEKIIEVEQTGPTTGNIVWEWHLWDHLVQNVDVQKANYQSSISAHPELMNINYATQKDWIHMNGIDYNESLDQITFSSHNMSEIYVIDHSTTTAEAASHAGGNSGHGGDFLYRWGNPQVYSAGTATDKILKVVHDAHWIPAGTPNAGRLVGFNNDGISSTQSCVDQVEPPLNGNNLYDLNPGPAYSPASYTLRTACNGRTSNEGNSQQLPNGNQLICMAFLGTIYEIDPAGNVVWTQTVSGHVPQAFRYSECYVNGSTPVTPIITQSNDTLYSSGGTGYQWYFEGNIIPGATSNSYLPTQSGIYTVIITDSFGCVSSFSNPFTVSVVAVAPSLAKGWALYPNPNRGSLRIQSPANADFVVSVADAYGKRVAVAANAEVLDMSDLQPGLYFVSIYQGSQHVGTQKIMRIR
jgi:Arylsulfotransferase (ASST)/Secretion system C-terminal sorting domain